MRLSDGVLLAVEGVMPVTQEAIKQACQEGLPISIVNALGVCLADSMCAVLQDMLISMTK